MSALVKRAPQNVTSAVKQAADKTGISFSYLMHKAAAESGFRQNAKAKTSSASGLFQFIESTWMDMVKRHGTKYGLKTDGAKQTVLAQRNDPKAAAFMAAEFARENHNYLQKHVNGPIGETELYFAHFMGKRGGAAFLNQLHKNPAANAADLFPKEARANRAVFYEGGRAKSMAEIYDHFAGKFGQKGAQMAAVSPLRQTGAYEAALNELQNAVYMDDNHNAILASATLAMPSVHADAGDITRQSEEFVTPLRRKGYSHRPFSLKKSAQIYAAQADAYEGRTAGAINRSRGNPFGTQVIAFNEAPKFEWRNLKADPAGYLLSVLKA